MWLFLIIGAGISALINIMKTIKNEDARLFRYMSVSLLALSLCAINSMNVGWIMNKDWTALLDVSETMSIYMWWVTILLILINSISLFREYKNEKNSKAVKK